MKDLILEYRSSPTASPNHHRITSKDKAIIIGVSKIEEFNTHLISSATEHDANVVHDIFTDKLGLKPSSVQVLSALSRTQPTLKNIKKCLKETMCSMTSGSTLFIYLSGQCHDTHDKCYFLPQDFSRKNSSSQLLMSDLSPYIRKCKAAYVVFILDCDNSETLVKPLVDSVQELKQELYFITSRAGRGMSLSDEKVLTHGYMTFLIKQFLKQSLQSCLSLTELTLYITKYSEPLSRFTYHHTHKQMVMSPKLIHKSRDGNIETVEVDGMRPSNDVTRWTTYILSSNTYTTWLKEREADAKVLFSEETFASTKLFAHVFLTCLKSMGVLLCDLDNAHLEISKEDIPSLCEALNSVVEEWFEPLVSPEHCRCNDFVGLSGMYKVYIRKGFEFGAGMLKRQAREAGERLAVSEAVKSAGDTFHM